MPESTTIADLHKSDSIKVTLEEFLGLVKSDDALRQHTQVDRVEGWESHGLVTHRFCVIRAKYNVPGALRCTFYIRIDRRMRKNSFKVLRGKSDRKDEVTLSRSVATILEPSKRRQVEYALEFPSPITLDLVVDTLSAIHEELLLYDLLQENCWALTIFVLEFLQIRGKGKFEAGWGTAWPNWAPLARDRIYAKFSLEPRPVKFVLSSAYRDERQKEIEAALTVPPGSEFNRTEVCMESTRTLLTEDVRSWYFDAQNDKKIFWLEGHLGTGKTAFAHTIAALFHEMGCLGASFFFKLGDGERETGKQLFGSIARQLSKFSEEIQYGVWEALKERTGLGTSPWKDQFENLIRIPCSRYSGRKRIVVVIDAVDESLNRPHAPELMDVLLDEVSKLVPTIRFFITSRPNPEIDPTVFRFVHLHLAQIHISSDESAGHIRDLVEENRSDLEKFVAVGFRGIATRYGLAEGWPGDSRRVAFLQRASGLFIWAVTVLRFLREKRNGLPDQRLRMILTETSSAQFNPENQMDILYTQILSSCNWNDRLFHETYYQLVGTMLAAKEDLSITSLLSLHRGMEQGMVSLLRPLSPLIIGLDASVDLFNIPAHDAEYEPLRFLHLSCRQFLMNPESTPYSFNIAEQHALLSVRCVKVLRQDLEIFFSSVTEWHSEAIQASRGIPVNRSLPVPAALAYAVKYWLHHALATTPPFSENVKLSTGEITISVIFCWIQMATYAFTFPEGQHLTALIDGDLVPMLIKHSDEATVRLGKICFALSNQLEWENRREEALAAIEQAVELRSALAAEQPDAFNPDLARSLNNLSERLSDLGRREEALDAIEQAVTLYRALLLARPDTSISNLAQALNNLSNCLSKMGRREEALAASEQTVKVRRTLAAYRPDAFNADLAGSLNNLSIHLSGLGRREEALAAIEEAVELHRALATERPDAFKGDLAGSLHNLCQYLSDIGQSEKALAAIEQAVELYRALAAARPDAFNPNLARSLSHLSNCLSDMGRREEALAAIEQAVELCRALATVHPDAYNPDLAQFLNNLGNHLSSVGRQEEALAALEQAVDLCHPLAGVCPDAFRPYLADSLHNLSLCIAGVGRREEALAVIKQAVELYRALAAVLPEAFSPGLAGSLHALSQYSSDAGQLEEALAACEQAVELYRSLAAARPDAFSGNLAQSMHSLGVRLSDVGRQKEALAVVEQAVELCRALATVRPAVFHPDLAQLLNNLSYRLLNLGRQEEALTAIEQAVEISRALATDHPNAFNPNLAESLHSLANCLASVGRREEALAAISQAVELRRALAAVRPDVANPDLARSLKIFSICLINVGRQEEAFDTIGESAKLHRALAQALPRAFNSDLAHTLWTQARILNEGGQSPKLVSGVLAETCRLYYLSVQWGVNEHVSPIYFSKCLRFLSEVSDNCDSHEHGTGTPTPSALEQQAIRLAHVLIDDNTILSDDEGQVIAYTLQALQTTTT